MNGRTAAMRRLPRTPLREAGRFASPIHNSAPHGPAMHNSAPDGPAIHNSAPDGPAIHNSAPEGPAIHNSASGPFSYTQFDSAIHNSAQLYTIPAPGGSPIHNSAPRGPAPPDSVPCPSAARNHTVRAFQRPYGAPRPGLPPPYAHASAFRRGRTGLRRPYALHPYTIRRSYTQFGAAIHNSAIHNSAPSDRAIHNSARPGRGDSGSPRSPRRPGAASRPPTEPRQALPAVRR